LKAQEWAIEQPRRDLADYTWEYRHGHPRTHQAFVGSLRLIVGQP
jgi:hypothetical protein